MSEYIVERVYDQTTGLDHFGRREEIVRCRDCRYYDSGKWCCEPSKVMIDEYGIEICATVTPDGFCAWGERRTAVP